MEGQRQLKREVRKGTSARWYCSLRPTVVWVVGRCGGLGWTFLEMVFVVDLFGWWLREVLVIG